MPFTGCHYHRQRHVVGGQAMPHTEKVTQGNKDAWFLLAIPIHFEKQLAQPVTLNAVRGKPDMRNAPWPFYLK